ncbi:unnamed protein product [Lampetra planeri]
MFLKLARRMVEEAGRPRALVIREGSQQRPRAMLILTPELASYRQPHHLQPIAEEASSLQVFSAHPLSRA